MKVILQWSDIDVREIAEKMGYDLTYEELEEICNNAEETLNNNDWLNNTISDIICDEIEEVKGESYE